MMKNLALGRAIRAFLKDGVGMRLISRKPTSTMFSAISQPGRIGASDTENEMNIGSSTSIAPAGAGTPTKWPARPEASSDLASTLKRASRSTQLMA